MVLLPGEPLIVQPSLAEPEKAIKKYLVARISKKHFRIISKTDYKLSYYQSICSDWSFVRCSKTDFLLTFYCYQIWHVQVVIRSGGVGRCGLD